MPDINIRKQGRAGRITLTRAKALNAMSYDMCLAIEAALDSWVEDDEVSLVVIDAEGDKAFCAGGDIAELYSTGMAQNYSFGQKFWADEYRLNCKMSEYIKPIVTFMQGFTMGGGVGIGCHASHRIVGDTSQIAMPECGIGLVPDVGGSLILARAPGRLGEYLGLTTARMGPADALLAGFGDYYIPKDQWPDLIADLEASADPAILANAARPAPEGKLAALQTKIDATFAGEDLRDILNALESDGSEFAQGALKAIRRASPLSQACTVEMLHRVRARPDMRYALDQEYRFTARAMEQGDFLEGIRAQIIDKDRNPQWKHSHDAVPAVAVSAMLRPLKNSLLTFEKET